MRATTDKRQSRGSIPGRPCAPHSSPDVLFSFFTHILYVFLKKKKVHFFKAVLSCWLLLRKFRNLLGFGRVPSLDYLTIFFSLFSHLVCFVKKESSFFFFKVVLFCSFSPCVSLKIFRKNLMDSNPGGAIWRKFSI